MTCTSLRTSLRAMMMTTLHSKSSSLRISGKEEAKEKSASGRRGRRTKCIAGARRQGKEREEELVEEEEEEEDEEGDDILLSTLQKCFVDINRPPKEAEKVVEILRENWFDDIDALISLEDGTVLVKPEEWIAMRLPMKLYNAVLARSMNSTEAVHDDYNEEEEEEEKDIDTVVSYKKFEHIEG